MKLRARSQGISPKDFVSKDESVSRSRKGKRQYLKDSLTRRMMRELDDFFLSSVEIPAMRRARAIGKQVAKGWLAKRMVDSFLKRAEKGLH